MKGMPKKMVKKSSKQVNGGLGKQGCKTYGKQIPESMDPFKGDRVEPKKKKYPDAKKMKSRD